MVPLRSRLSLSPRMAPRTTSRSASSILPSALIIKNMVSASGSTRDRATVSSLLSNPSRVRVS